MALHNLVCCILEILTVKTFVVPAVIFKGHSRSSVMSLDRSPPTSYAIFIVVTCLSSIISEIQNVE